MRTVGLTLGLLGLLWAGPGSAVVPASPPTSAAVEQELSRLRSPDPVDRIEAARALRNMGEQAAPAVPVLRELLADDAQATVGTEACPSVVGAAAAAALSGLGPAGVDALLAALSDARPVVRARAAAGLGGPKDRRAIAPLVALMGDRESIVRAAAVSSLGDIYFEASLGEPTLGEEQARVGAALRKALEDPV